jgi:hypothetical protein
MNYLTLSSQCPIKMAFELEEEELARLKLETLYNFSDFVRCPETYKMMVDHSNQILERGVLPSLEKLAKRIYLETKEDELRILEDCSEGTFVGSVSGLVANYLKPNLDANVLYSNPVVALSCLENHFLENSKR